MLIPVKLAGREIDLSLTGADDFATQIDWDWMGGGTWSVPPVPEGMTARNLHEVFNETAPFIAKIIKERPPQRYSFRPLTQGHRRRYARDMERLLGDSGYRMAPPDPTDPGWVLIEPTPRAYMNYAGGLSRPPLASGLLTAAALSEGSNRATR